MLRRVKRKGRQGTTRHAGQRGNTNGCSSGPLQGRSPPVCPMLTHARIHVSNETSAITSACTGALNRLCREDAVAHETCIQPRVALSVPSAVRARPPWIDLASSACGARNAAVDRAYARSIVRDIHIHVRGKLMQPGVDHGPCRTLTNVCRGPSAHPRAT